MESFLERFFAQVDKNLNDAHASRRLSTADKLRDLYTVEKLIWERLLTSTGQESTVGRVEASIVLTPDIEFYRLPSDYRRFHRFELRDSGNSNLVSARLPSISHEHPGPGVVILDAQRGIIIRPKPAATETWTLIYQRGPGRMLHQASATSVSDRSLISAGPVSTADGEIVRTPDYYKGGLLHIYQASIGNDQTAEVTSWDITVGAVGAFGFRHAFPVTPQGNVKYEMMPMLPADYDELYALDVALKNLARRGNQKWRDLLVSQRRELWSGCQNYFMNQVADRSPTRTINYDRAEVDPYEDYWGWC